jgi:hypothetical protein
MDLNAQGEQRDGAHTHEQDPSATGSGELQSVFEGVLASAAHLCEAKFGVRYRSEGDRISPIRWTARRR